MNAIPKIRFVSMNIIIIKKLPCRMKMLDIRNGLYWEIGHTDSEYIKRSDAKWKGDIASRGVGNI